MIYYSRIVKYCIVLHEDAEYAILLRVEYNVLYIRASDRRYMT